MKRNILLNPGPATTTDTVKMAQVVPDICPREKEFGGIMANISQDLLKVVHADSEAYSAVLFCGSGTIGMDVCINSLLPEGKKLLIINNGAYSARGVDIAEAYGLAYIDLQFPVDSLPDLVQVQQILEDTPEIGIVYTTHQETGTGILNPIREIGALAHKYSSVFIVDTTSTYAMRPIDIVQDNIDFCMASAQKGLQAMTGLSFVIGRTAVIEASKKYPVRSYYCNLYRQYAHFRETGQMHFTPPVQVIYALRQALQEYFSEGERAKWQRHQAVMSEIHAGLERLGLREVLPREIQAGLVAAVAYPDNPKWDFNKVHDYCYKRGFTIYPGKMQTQDTFRLCALGAITPDDIKAFWLVFAEALKELEK